MFGNRVDTSTFVKKPKVILDGRFPLIHDLSVGDKGQLDAVLEIVGVFTETDENGAEQIHYRVKLVKAVNIEETMRRV